MGFMIPSPGEYSITTLGRSLRLLEGMVASAMKKFLLSLFLLSLFFLILLLPQSSIGFASQGLILWYQTVVPALFPSMLLSSLMVETGAASLLMGLIHPLLGKLLGTSPDGTYCFLMGLLCGYPMGAKTCADMIRRSRISREEGRYLMAFIHFPSPMFVVGYIASVNLILPTGIPILAAVYFPAIPLCLLSRRRYCPTPAASPCQISHTCSSARGSCAAAASNAASGSVTPDMLDRVITSGSAVMLKIGIYMMIFNILAGFSSMISLPSPLSLDPDLFAPFLCGILEMTTGIRLVSQTSLPLLTKGCLICFFSSFGGMSVAMQIQSALGGSGLSLRHILPWQLLHGLLAAVIFGICFFFLM